MSLVVEILFVWCATAVSWIAVGSLWCEACARVWPVLVDRRADRFGFLIAWPLMVLGILGYVAVSGISAGYQRLMLRRELRRARRARQALRQSIPACRLVRR